MGRQHTNFWDRATTQFPRRAYLPATALLMLCLSASVFAYDPSGASGGTYQASGTISVSSSALVTGGYPTYVNGELQSDVLDAMRIINELNAHGAHALAPSGSPPGYRWDVNEDGQITALDATILINRLNNSSSDALTSSGNNTTIHGTYNLTGGTANNGAGRTTVVTVEGGQPNYTGNLIVGRSGNGTLTQTGGTIELATPSSAGTINVAPNVLVGGIDATGFPTLVGGYGTLNISGNAVGPVGTTSPTGGDMALAILSDSTANVSLNGGLLDVSSGSGKIGAGAGTVNFNFTGGTLKVKDFYGTDLGGNLGGLIQSNGWHNFKNTTDVDGDHESTASDVMLIINELNAHGPHALQSSSSPTTYWDVNGDGAITALDASIVINQLNGVSSSDLLTPLSLSVGPGSPVAVPEPSTIVLALLGGVALLGVARRRKTGGRTCSVAIGLLTLGLSVFVCDPSDASSTLVKYTYYGDSDLDAMDGYSGFSPWHNFFDPTDVDGDYQLTPLDAMLIINQLNAGGVRTFSMTESLSASPAAFWWDVNGDRSITALDASIVINRLNGSSSGVLTSLASDTTIHGTYNLSGGSAITGAGRTTVVTGVVNAGGDMEIPAGGQLDKTGTGTLRITGAQTNGAGSTLGDAGNLMVGVNSGTGTLTQAAATINVAPNVLVGGLNGGSSVDYTGGTLNLDYPSAYYDIGTGNNNTGILNVRGVAQSTGGTLKLKEFNLIDFGVIDPVNAWHNFLDSTDVDGDHELTPLDAMIIINELNAQGPHALGTVSSFTNFCDVNNDRAISALDASIVINRLNGVSSDSLTPLSLSAGPGSSVPEPSTIVLALLGGAGLLCAARRKRARGRQ